MIELSASIISSTISTVLLYPAQRIKIQMQLSTAKFNKENKKQTIITRQVDQLLDIQEEEIVQLEQQNGGSPTRKYKSSIKYEFQTQSKEMRQRYQKDKSNNKTHSTVSQTCLQIYKKAGWSGFYSGLQSLVIGNGLSYGVYFVVYQKCKKYLGFIPGSIVDTIKCSAIAGVAASLSTNPFWVLQTKQSQQKGSIIQKGKQLINRQGIFALWKGLSSSLILISNPIIQFVIYEQLKKVIPIDKNSRFYDLVIFLMGALSKLISTIFTYPLTVIRTKQHVNTQKIKRSVIIKQIYQSQGIKGFFHGIQPKLVQTVLNSALLLMLFQKIRTILINYFRNSGK